MAVCGKVDHGRPRQSQVVGDFLVTTWWLLGDHLVTTWRLLGDHLVTTWRPLDDHNPRCYIHMWCRFSIKSVLLFGHFAFAPKINFGLKTHLFWIFFLEKLKLYCVSGVSSLHNQTNAKLCVVAFFQLLIGRKSVKRTCGKLSGGADIWRHHCQLLGKNRRRWPTMKIKEYARWFKFELFVIVGSWF